MQPTPTPSRQPNALIHESSPYLLQHAYNPVQWMPWNKQSLELAKRLDKPIILSIGYSTCHWCHVMERECFEDEEIADIMNAHFINIKLDREERPDIDSIYMDAVQAMGLPGGWPLNVFLLPDRRPFFGGTYFPPQHWKQLLLSVIKAYKYDRQQLEKAAEDITHSLQADWKQRFNYKAADRQTNRSQELLSSLQQLSQRFDTEWGGFQGAPKFPTPCVYAFLQAAGYLLAQPAYTKQVERTLAYMYQGGIYDHVGGGFARYSVDNYWHVPHFEKMLYDNAQLIGLYASSYMLEPNLYKQEAVWRTFHFLQTEMRSPEGAYYAAIDADSQGEEGKYYVWHYEELLEVLGKDMPAFEQMFDVQPEGNWEYGKNVIRRRCLPIDEQSHQRSLEWLGKLYAWRQQRPRPALDNKILTSWNALLISGLLQAYHAFGERAFLSEALQIATFIRKHLINQGQVYHSFQAGHPKGEGLAEDYATIIAAWIELYQNTFEEQWLAEAQELLESANQLFLDHNDSFYYMSFRQQTDLISNKKNLFDSVIPSENSLMAHNLYRLGLLFDKSEYIEQAHRMLEQILPMMQQELRYLSHWGLFWLHTTLPFAEVVIVGEQATTVCAALCGHYQPNKIIAGTCQLSGKQSLSPLLHARHALQGKTTLYICQQGSCQLPVFSVDQAIAQLQHIQQLYAASNQKISS